MKEAERWALLEDRERAVEGLARATDEQDRLTTRVKELADRGGPVNLARLALAVYRVSRVRARGEALKARLEETRVGERAAYRIGGHAVRSV